MPVGVDVSCGKLRFSNDLLVHAGTGFVKHLHPTPAISDLYVKNTVGNCRINRCELLHETGSASV